MNRVPHDPLAGIDLDLDSLESEDVEPVDVTQPIDVPHASEVPRG